MAMVKVKIDTFIESYGLQLMEGKLIIVLLM